MQQGISIDLGCTRGLARGHAKGLGGHQMVEDLCVEATANQKSPDTKGAGVKSDPRRRTWRGGRIWVCTRQQKWRRALTITYHFGKIGLGVGVILTKDPFKRTDRGPVSD